MTPGTKIAIGAAAVIGTLLIVTREAKAKVLPVGYEVKVPNASIALAKSGFQGTNPLKVLNDVLSRTDPQTIVITSVQGDMVQGVLAGLNVTFPASSVIGEARG